MEQICTQLLIGYQTCEHTTIFVPGRGQKYSATKCEQAVRDFWFSFQQGFPPSNVLFCFAKSDSMNAANKLQIVLF